jgi:hypothetical protein
LSGQCRGVKRDGSQCTATVNPPQSYCWWHSPENAGTRRAAASKGGRAKASKVTKKLHELLEDLTQRVIDGKLETSRGAVANQLISTRIRLLEFERRAREQEELVGRLEELERLLEDRTEAGRWGA